jgi:hypothetical protein
LLHVLLYDTLRLNTLYTAKDLQAVIFKKYSTQFIYTLLLISTCLYGAEDNSQEYSALKAEFGYPPRLDTFDPYGLRAKAAARDDRTSYE